MKPHPATYQGEGAASVYLNWTGRTKRFLRRRDGDDCWVCGLAVDFECDTDAPLAATIEHKIPSSRGGTGNRLNLVLSHGKCNKVRGSVDGRIQRGIPVDLARL